MYRSYNIPFMKKHIQHIVALWILVGLWGSMSAQPIKVLQVQDIYTGANSSNPSYLTVFENKLYFAADSGNSLGNELWSYDHINGAILVSDINSPGSSSPSNLLTIEEKMLFSADDGSGTGSQLWELETGNVMLSDPIINNSGSANPQWLTIVQENDVYFQADNGMDGIELWKYTDGMPSLVANINSGPVDSDPKHFALFLDTLFFQAADINGDIELWKYDFSNPPSVAFNINMSNESLPSYLTVWNDKLYFTADDGINGSELYVYDGTSTPSLVHNINPSGNANPHNLTVFNNQLYFAADDGTNGVELWIYDGTTTPNLVSNQNLSGDFDPANLVVFESKLYFTGDDGISGTEIWQYDGVAASPILAYDINPNTASGSNPQNLTVLNKQLYFSADTGGSTGNELWALCLVDTIIINQLACNFYVHSTYDTLRTNGTYIDTTTNQYGCDSITTINLHIDTTVVTQLIDTSCQWYIVGNGDTIKETSIYRDTTNSLITGCDSITIIDFTYGVFDTITLAPICDSLLAPSGTKYFTTSGTYNDTLTSQIYPCDSILTLHLTINKSSDTILYDTVCNSYLSPSQNDTWLTSDTYYDTITNATNCDSFITIHLIVNAVRDTLFNQTACDTFYSPSGKKVTAIGTHYDTLFDYTGCDSILYTIYLTDVFPITYHSIIDTVCANYTAPSGTILTVSGIYPDTLSNQNAFGCDSIITINLTVQQTYDTIDSIVCNSYISPSGKVWTTSGNRLDTLAGNNQFNCDSIILINLTVNNLASEIVTETHCDAFTTASGITYFTSGTYYDTLQTTQQCDSFITYNITINYSSYDTITASFCDRYVATSGAIFTQSGTFYDITSNSIGCDSLTTLQLTFNGFPSVNVSSATIQGTTTLSSTTTASTYQWLNCSNGFSLVSGAASQTFAPTTTGSYAVVVSNGLCNDTSSCINVQTVLGIGQYTDQYIHVYPNPTSDNFVQLTSNYSLQDISVRVFNTSGKLLSQTTSLTNEVSDKIFLGTTSGIYIIQLTDQQGNSKQLEVVKE